jgi:hypothetical protein
MMTNSETRSAADIQRDIEQTRQNAAATLAQIEQRLAPGRLIDQAVDSVRRSPQVQSYASDMNWAVRKNPLPLLLVAVGLSWLLINTVRQSNSRYPDRPIGASRVNSTAATGRPAVYREPVEAL